MDLDGTARGGVAGIVGLVERPARSLSETLTDMSGSVVALIQDREHQYRLGPGELELQRLRTRLQSASWLVGDTDTGL